MKSQLRFSQSLHPWPVNGDPPAPDLVVASHTPSVTTVEFRVTNLGTTPVSVLTLSSPTGPINTGTTPPTPGVWGTVGSAVDIVGGASKLIRVEGTVAQRLALALDLDAVMPAPANLRVEGIVWSNDFAVFSGTDGRPVTATGTATTGALESRFADIGQDTGRLALNALPWTAFFTLVDNVVEGDLVSIGSFAFEFVDGGPATPGRIAVEIGDGLPATGIANLVTAFRAAGIGAVALNEGAPNQGVVALATSALVVTSTMDGAGNEWDQSPMAGGQEATSQRPVTQLVTRTITADEETAGRAFFALNFHPTVATISLLRAGTSVTWDGSVVVGYNVVTVINGSGETLQEGDVVSVIALR